MRENATMADARAILDRFYCVRLGVSIRDQVSEATAYEWSLGAVYVPLDKLTRKGHIEKSYSRPEARRGGRSKVLYHLTAKGREALRTVRQMQTALWKGIPGRAFEEEA